jgi:hypothetical protein
MFKLAYENTLQWSPGAVAAYKAIRERALHDGTISLPEILSALAVDTLPNESVLGGVLRDPTIWPSVLRYVRVQVAGGQPNLKSVMFNFVNLGFEVESKAREEKSHTVGERHIAKRLLDASNEIAQFELNAQSVYRATHIRELGQEFEPELVLGWHGLIETNVIIEFRDLWEIDWVKEVGGKPVTLWITTALLDELEDMKYHRNERVAKRVAVFSRWFRKEVTTSERARGVALRDGVTMRVWTPVLTAETPDTRHLEAALLLKDKNISVRVVTYDNLLTARCLQYGVEVFSLSDQYLIRP